MSRRNLIVASMALAALTSACGGGAGGAQPAPVAQLPAGTLSRVEIPPITGKTASIDILWLDQKTHLLYAADRTDGGVDVVDVSTPHARYLKTFITPNTAPNGILVVDDVNKLYSGNNDSTVSIFDLKTGKLLASPNTGGKNRADEIGYDPKDKKLYVANSSDGIVTVIDAVSNAILKKFDNVSSGGLEQPRYDPVDGKMYLTLSDDNAIVQFDPTTDTLVKKFDVGVTCGPQGIDINPKTNQALLGCNNKKKQSAVVWDMAAGKVVSSFPDAGAGDAVLYDAKADRFFFAAANFTKNGQPAPELAIFSGGPVTFLSAMPTKVGSHGVAYDELNKIIYVQDQSDSSGGLLAFPLPR